MSPSDPVITAIVERLRKLETNQRAEQAGAVEAVLFANLPAAGKPGRIMFVTNGRKPGQGAGAGTGVLAVDDGTIWESPENGGVAVTA